MALAGPLYLFCTWTRAFCRFLRIMRFEFSKSFRKFDDYGRTTPAASTNLREFVREFARLHRPFPPPPLFFSTVWVSVAPNSGRLLGDRVISLKDSASRDSWQARQPGGA